MSAKPVKLAVHKSQIERQRRKAVQRDMTEAAKHISNSANIVAYGLVGLSDDGRAFSSWDTGGIVPMWAFPPTIAEVLREDMAQSEIDEDFKRPLIDRAWKGSK